MQWEWGLRAQGRPTGSPHRGGGHGPSPGKLCDASGSERGPWGLLAESWLCCSVSWSLEHTEREVGRQEAFLYRQGPELRVHTSLPSCLRTLGPTAPGRIIEASGGAGGIFLKDIVAYVEVWSSQQDRELLRHSYKQLEDMGKKVLKPFNK